MDNASAAKQGNLIVIVGPTAVGKTELCIRLAQHYRTVVVSADSRQFYREMAIGTAKPTLAERRNIPHYFIDSHQISQEYSTGAYEQDALEKLKVLFQQHHEVLLTGGSGLYVRALLEGMDDMPEVPDQLREQLIQQEQEQGLAFLLAQLQQLDPVYFNQVDKHNPQRVIRALEVTLATGQPYSSFRKKTPVERPFNVIKIGLTRPRAELYDRINTRVDQMLENGLLTEVKSLYPFKNHNALQTVGYQEIFNYLEGFYDWPEAVRLLKRNSRRYAKRQLTWFRKDAGYTWFHPDDFEGILSFIEEKKL